MTTVSPKGHLLYLFFRDLAPGAFPLRVSIETTNHCNLRCRLRELHEQGRSGEVEPCRDCPDHLP